MDMSNGQVTLTENFPDRTVWWGTQTITSLICENKCGFVVPLSYVPFVAKMSQTPIENMVWTNSHAYAQNSINLHNTLYPPKIITLFRVYPRLIDTQNLFMEFNLSSNMVLVKRN